jgi:hypothetical protein
MLASPAITAPQRCDDQNDTLRVWKEELTRPALFDKTAAATRA